MKNKNIAKVVSDCILVLADYTDRIVELYPGLASKEPYTPRFKKPTISSPRSTDKVLLFSKKLQAGIR